MVVTLAWLAPCAAEVEEARVAVITLVPVHSHLTLAHARAVTEGANSTIRVASAGQAASGAIVEVSVLTHVTL